MLSCQRAIFDIPRDVTYLNAASWSPLPHPVQQAGQDGIARKAQPWTITAEHQAEQFARARAAAAFLLNASPEDIALIPSVSYGVATFARCFAPKRKSRVLVLADDHSSPVLEWMQRAAAQGFVIDTVATPEDGDWTAAVLEAIARKGAPPLSLASISSVHWSDGGLLDLEAIAAALRACGAALLIDATHHAGMLPIDVARLDPDAVVFPTYKWVLGPYGRAFLYLAKRWQDGVPLEQPGSSRRAVNSERLPYLADLAFAEGAKRFDMGERDHVISLEMASVGMEMMAGWGIDAIGERCAMLTARLAAGLEGLPVTVPVARVRAPHVLSIGFPAGMPDGLVPRLAERKVHVASRLGRVRISPHVYNDDLDIDRCVKAFHAELMG